MMEDEDSTIFLTDENGNEAAFEMIGEVEYEGQKYAALFMLDDENEDNDEIGIVMLHMTEEGDQIFFDTVMDEDLLDRVFDKFAQEREASPNKKAAQPLFCLGQLSSVTSSNVALSAPCTRVS